MADLLVTVMGPGGHSRPVKVRGDVPARQLAGVLGSTVGVTTVEGLSFRGGRRIDPDETLSGAGALMGSTLVVDGRNDIGATAASPPPPPAKPNRPARARGGVTIAVAAMAAATAAVVGVVVGATIFSAGSPAPAPSTVTPPAATAAVRAWLAGRGAGRAGAALDARVETVRTVAGPGGQSVTEYIAGVAGKVAWGLSVMVDHGRVVGPVSVTGLPFGGETVRPGGQQITVNNLPPVVDDWARATFGAGSALAGQLGVALDAPPIVVRGWLLPKGSLNAAVLRVELRLSSTAPGTPTAAASDADGATDAAKATLATDGATASQAAAVAAQANAAVAAVNPPPAPAPVIAAAQAAQAASAQANTKVAADQAALATATQAATTARTVPGATGPPVVVTTRYDIGVGSDTPTPPVTAYGPAGAGG